MPYRIGIDVGGTFTDFLLAGEDGERRPFKVLSTPADPSVAVLAGLQEMADAKGLPLAEFLAQVPVIVHGTTVTTNAVLTGRIAKTGLMTTRGFRDALQMRRGVRERPYDNKYPPAPSPVPRPLRLPVTERVNERGEEIVPLNLDDVDSAIAAFKAAEVEAVAICFMHAWANADHERVAAERVRAAMPGVFVSVSSSVLPQVRFYERISTTVLNAAVGPILNRYIDNLKRRLNAAGFTGILLIMQSNGGVATPETVQALAVSTLLSGPAAAPVAGLQLLQSSECKDFITVDMGGTSFDAALVRDGRPAITTASQVNRFAMALPSLEIITIGAGGGSIAKIDAGGLLRLGPESAGADPGPACYGRGGQLPTCSDANLVLGYLSPGYFAGGRMQLDIDAARRAIETHVAKPLGLTVEEAAAGMYRVINVNMASAIREISVQKGYDPRQFPLICAGGAGAIHAAMIARELGMRKILVPRLASIFCAAGMVYTDFKHDFVRSFACALTESSADLARIPALIRELEAEAADVLASEGIASDRRRLSYALDLRYRGQYHEITVDVAREDLDPINIAAIADRFHARHDELYGYSLAQDGTTVTLISIRLSAVGLTPRLASSAGQALGGSDASNAKRGQRPIWIPQSRTFEVVDVYDGDRLAPGFKVSGPTIVETTNTTIVVPKGFDLSVDAAGTCQLDTLEGA